VPRKKNNNAPGHALPMFNDPVSSPVLPMYFAPQPPNLVGVALKPLKIVKRSKWLTLYPDSWDPARLALVKEASTTNYWYQFLYDIFVDGKLSRWGDGISNVLSFLVKAEILKLMKVGIDLVPLTTYKFVFACVTCLWKTDLERGRLQVLVDAIEKNPHLVPKAHRFLYLLFSSRCENPLYIVPGNTFDLETGTKLVVHRRTPFNGLHFYLASKFLLGLCPKCLEQQVSNSLLASAGRTHRCAEAHILLFQMSDHQEGIVVDNRYSLIQTCKDIWGHYVGSKFLIIFSM
jgi:hypothetical protein